MSALVPAVLGGVPTAALGLMSAHALRLRRANRHAADRHRLELDRAAALERALADEELRGRLRDEAIRRFASSRLPELLAAVWRGHPAEPAGTAYPAQLAGSDFTAVLDHLGGEFARIVEDAAQRAEGATKTTVLALARALTALVNEQQAAVDRLTNSHGDVAVLADAMAIDHTVSQLSRRVQGIAVLTGAWPGLQRADSPLLDVTRGAVSRIRDYQRIEITGAPDVAVASRCVEGVVIALAELLDNAARHSHPETRVRVWFDRGHHGTLVTVDDAGPGLGPEDRVASQLVLSGQTATWLTRLGNPVRLGLPIVAALADRYGFQVNVGQESDAKGVRAVVFLPNTILAPLPAPAGAGTQAADAGAEAYPRRADGLPQRTPRTPRTASAPATGSADRAGAGHEDHAATVSAVLRGRHAARQQFPEPTTTERT
ncbi:ATP-binding protein [Kitasatospora sp. NPDC048540]|uniref:ATP-binding protein n=1 Tax=Kitasatospora sp. NPDC048540 TaxID=3155634 RepID=UPI0033C0BD67